MSTRRFLCLTLAAAVALVAAPVPALEFHGYLRSGIGGSAPSGNQVCFVPAQIGYKFRLGNECENYAELELRQSVYKDKGGVELRYIGMLGYKTGALRDAEPLNAQGNEFQLRQNYVIATGVPFLKGASAWVGKRYYHRNDVHIIDFYYWDPSGPGVGVDDIDLGFAKLAVALFQSKGGWGLGYGVQNELTIYRPDVRLFGISVPGGGNLEVGFNADIASGVSAATTADTFYFSPMVTVQHVQPNVLGGFNKLALQYANGMIAPMTSYPEPQNGGKAQRARVVEQLGFQPSPKWSGMAVVVFEDVTSQYGGPGSSDVWNSFRTWSIGARPAFHVNDYLKLQAEAGFQWYHAKGPNLDPANLFKLTFAPTLTPPPGPGGAYYTRPELRLFVTYAGWNEAMNSYFQTWNAVWYSGPGAGGPASIFGNDNHGVTFGAQVEAWF